MTTPRRFIRAGAAVVFMGGLAITGITAFACTSTATLSFSRGGVATVGDTVTGTGANFSVAPGHSPVSLYLNGFSGTPLTTASVAANGTISFQFVAPNVSSQYNFVGATETDSAGNSLTMGKVRASLTVNAPPAPQPPPAPVQP
ncbi:MAG TPA: hypothetical protein VFO60_02370, partial [Candidatus Dormibacteraeota bacterium]|nr:hypothetical protein [Candidatus Dormibacteraeota bacterium]